MNFSGFRSVTLRLTLCAAIAPLTLAAPQLHAQDAKDGQAAPPVSEMPVSEMPVSEMPVSEMPVSEMYDEGFAKHVDLRMLGIAWQTVDAKMMADVALQLREAENVLGRKHPKITSDQILKLASKAAADSEDNATLERLARVAEASGNTAEVNKMKQFKSLSAASRDLKGDLKNATMFSANDVTNGALAAFGNLVLQIRAAKVAGDKGMLKSLAEGSDLLSSLRDSHRSKLRGLIDDAVGSVGEADDSIAAINKLTGPSRSLGLGGTTYLPPAQLEQLQDPGMMPQINSLQGASRSLEAPSGESETAYAAGGMKYVMSPVGAVVQSPGRIGTLVFATGDVILSIAGVPLGTGVKLDKAIDLGYLNGTRSLTLRDSASGQVTTLMF